MPLMLGDVFASLFRRPATERYPYATRTAPVRLRGKLLWDSGKCRGCMLCVRDCPAQAVTIDIVDRAAKLYVFHYHVGRCIYCAQCVVSCREGALSMWSELYHLSSADKASFAEVHRSAGSGRDTEAGR
jgi:formate hydrogenlyase subunit 6/NADH:ubiquinone oxidoreductase subunit I